jgi:prevent-host-death family protein
VSIVNIHEAKTHLSRLVERAAAGEEIVIAKAGTPMAKLVRYERPKQPRVPGGWEGRVWIAPDFDEVDSEIVSAFEGDES